MLLRYFYDDKLAHASYMVGCQRTGEAIVVDPSRDITKYLEVAKKEGLNIVAATESHIHADFVSGARELGRLGAKLYLSDEGGEGWTYQNLEGFEVQLLKDGDSFNIGNIKFDVLHTPGHTPESISLILTDIGGGADKPMGAFTGDFVFVGDVGRPDLLEKAAGQVGTSEAGAKDMFNSINRFKQLPDFLQIWPAHGAGSACGKALGAIPSSTLGYEKLFSWAFKIEDEKEFINALLDGQPEPPTYFAVMKRVNKTGLPYLEDLEVPFELTEGSELEELIHDEQSQVLDLRAANQFAADHLEGTFNIPFNKSFTNWAGWIVDYSRPLYLLTSKEQLEDVMTALHSIGIDDVKGYMDLDTALHTDLKNESYNEITPSDALKEIKANKVNVVDVRNLSEWNDGHIEGAKHIMLGTLLERLDEVPTDQPLIVNCQGGGRSAIAVSLLQSKGIKNVINLKGGYGRWVKEVH